MHQLYAFVKVYGNGDMRITVGKRGTARGSAAADSGKTRSNNQNDGWQDAPRIPAPKAVGCNRLLGGVLLYVLLKDQSVREKVAHFPLQPKIDRVRLSNECLGKRIIRIKQEFAEDQSACWR